MNCVESGLMPLAFDCLEGSSFVGRFVAVGLARLIRATRGRRSIRSHRFLRRVNYRCCTGSCQFVRLQDLAAHAVQLLANAQSHRRGRTTNPKLGRRWVGRGGRSSYPGNAFAVRRTSVDPDRGPAVAAGHYSIQRHRPRSARRDGARSARLAHLLAGIERSTLRRGKKQPSKRLRSMRCPPRQHRGKDQKNSRTPRHDLSFPGSTVSQDRSH